MKILYYSDKYAYNVMGTKRSIFEEVKRRGIGIIWKDKSLVNGILSHIEQHNPTQIWLASSDLILLRKLKAEINIPVIAFGFSDPKMFNQNRFYICDVYVSNYATTITKYKHQLPIIYNPTACDFKFHKRFDVIKKFDVTFIGSANPKRIEIVNMLRKDRVDVWVFGNSWPKHSKNFKHIEGKNFLQAINSSKIGLDIEDELSPLAHRMFEYSACGVPVVTRQRPEVFSFFEKDIEIKTYTDYDSLKECLTLLLKNGYKEVGENAANRCKRDHNISNRVDHLLTQLQELL